MPRILQLRRGTSTQLNGITGSEGEVFVDLSANTLRVHDGITQGGVTLATAGDVALKQNILQSGTNIKTINGQSIVGSGDISTASEIDLSAIMEDVSPAISGVYDIGTPDYQWYNGYFTNKIDIDGIAIENVGDGDLQITADTIITNSDLLANSLLLDDIFITDNTIKPLSTPLYGQRELIIDGGLHVATEDPAYIKLTQEIPVIENTISQRFSNIEDGYAFPWQTSAGYDDSFRFLMDVSQLATGFPQEMWVYNTNSDAYTQILAGQLMPGVKYKIEIDVIASYFSPYQGYYTTRTVLESYLFEEVEYVGSEVFAGDLYLKFKSPTPGSSATIGGSYDYVGWGSFGAGLDFVISVESTTIEYDYSVLDTYGSEGMIRFNPQTKEFEGHNGTAWDSVTTVDPATVFVNTPTLGVTTSLTVNEADAGLYNNFIGYQTGNNNTSGSNNNFFGSGAGRYNTAGCNNNFFGNNAGYCNTTGCNNNFFGRCAGSSNTTGVGNNFFGVFAGLYNTTGSSNNFFGSYAGCSNRTGVGNNFFGFAAGNCNFSGNYNNFIGYFAGRFNTSGSRNNFLGNNAGYCNTTGGCNNFFGFAAGRYNTSGSENNFFGIQAGLLNTTGYRNNFFGTCAGLYNTTGNRNNFFGREAGYKNTTGCQNTFIGTYAGRFNTTGSDNIFLGSGAGCCNTTGSRNNFLGSYAGRFNTTGCYNNFFGCAAGCDVTTGSSNTILGNVPGTSTLTSTVILAAGSTERLKVNSTGLYVNGTLLSGGGTTTNALTVSTGLALNSGTTFDGSVAKTISLATSGATAGTYGNNYSSGSYIYMPQFTVDSYGRITSVTTNYISLGGSSSSFSNIYVGATGSPPSGGTMVSADSSSDSLYLIAGDNITLSADSSYDSITISSTGGGASGITWEPNSTSGGSITVTNPAGYSTPGSTLVVVVAGATSPFVSSGSASFSQLFGVGNDTSVFYTSTGASPGASTTIGGIPAYAMAYAYIAGGSSGLSSSSAFSSSTSSSLANPSPNSGSPRIIAVSTSSVLNLATVAGPASGGGPTWAAGSGFAHPSTSSLSAAVWVGTGSWTSTATPTLTSNPSFGSWYISGITSFS